MSWQGKGSPEGPSRWRCFKQARRPADRQEFDAFCQKEGIDPDMADGWYDVLEQRDWTHEKSGGRALKSWQAYMAMTWIDFNNGKYSREHGDLSEWQYREIAVARRAKVGEADNGDWDLDHCGMEVAL